MTTAYQINATNDLASRTNINGWNDFTDPTLGATLPLLDSGNNTSPFSLEVTAAFQNGSGGITWATEEHYGFPAPVLQGILYTFNGGTSSFDILGGNEGDTYEIELVGYSYNAVRNTTFTVNGESADYQNGVGDAGITEPVVFTGIIGASNKIPVSLTKASDGQYYGQLCGLIFRHTPAVKTYTAPTGTVDSNSLFSHGVTYPSGATFTIVNDFEHGVVDWDTVDFSEDIQSIYTPEVNYIGTDSVTIALKAPDASVTEFTVTITLTSESETPVEPTEPVEPTTTTARAVLTPIVSGILK